MKILQLCNKLPYPEKDGGSIAVSTLTRGLIKAGCEVKMLSMNTKKHFTDINAVPAEFRTQTALEAVTIDTRVKAPKALLNLIAGKSYNVSRFYSHDFEKRLAAILMNGTFDLILLEGLYLTPYLPCIRKHSAAPVILRAHNVEWLIWHRLANEERFKLKKTYLNRLAKQLREYESGALNMCDGITVFSKTDKERFEEMGCKTGIEIFPIGLEHSNYTATAEPEPHSLFFIGALDWLPNLQGLEWLLNHAWNKIYAAYPHARFHIAGRNMPASLKDKASPGVVLHGQVDSAVNFMKNYSLMVVPLFAGSGIRVKIIEGMALRKTMITTSIGIEGIDCENGKEVIIANTNQEFFDAVKRCFDDNEYLRQIGINAGIMVKKNYNIDTICAGMLHFFKEMIIKKKATASPTLQ